MFNRAGASLVRTGPRRRRVDWRIVLLLAALAVMIGLFAVEALGKLRAPVVAPQLQPPPIDTPIASGPRPSGEVSANTGASAPTGTRTFHGYACTIDCTGHQAGYDWAKMQGIRDPRNCPFVLPNLHSVLEGCWAEAGRDGPLP